MHYPWWYVPYMTGPMLIAAIAIVHVLVSHYAVGGGIFLAVEATHAHKNNDKEYLSYLKKHARFFILITVVFGAVTGVGIWWTIGLTSPLATEMLIRTFVFGWAIEWVFFIVEIVSAFLFYYYWDRLPAKLHIILVWIYAIAAWISLVLISAITAFMLNSRGLMGDWVETGNFWDAMLNRQFLPQTIVRTGGSLLLASLYVYLHASWLLKRGRVRDLVQKRSAIPALIGVLTVLVGAGLWYLNLPPASRLVLEAAAVLNIFIGVLIGSSLVCVALIVLGPLRNPGWLSPGFSVALFLFGLAAFSTAEFIREAIRKPYIVDRVVLGNQITQDQIPELRRAGFLNGGLWTRAWVERNYPELMQDGQIDTSRFAQLDESKRIEIGAALFQYHCNDCHAAEHGYSAAGPLLTGRSREMVRRLIGNLHEEHFYMPPWCGNDDEAEVLTDYLMTIRPAIPDPIPVGEPLPVSSQQ